jgi:hypothetical protein
LKAIRLAVLSFLPHLIGRNILLHEDNHAGLLRPGRPDFPLPGNDERITPTLVLVGHQQHSHPTPVHPIRGEQAITPPHTESTKLKLKLKLFTTCASKLDRLLSLGPLYFAIHDLLASWARVSSTRYTY